MDYYYDRCERILKWSKYIKKFDTSFIESVMDYYDEHGEFTIAQEIAIDNIIRKFRISKKYQ